MYYLRYRLKFLFYRLFWRRISSHLKKEIINNFDNSKFIKALEKTLKIPQKLIQYIPQHEKDIIIKEADRSLQNIFNILGSRDTKLSPFDWHVDFKTGFRWPPYRFYKDYQQEDIESNSDVKIPRELSRCHHFLKVALAFCITEREEYAKFCVSQMTDWIKENPFMRSINWGCTMDVSIRAVNWIWSIGLISGNQLLSNDNIAKIKVSLYQHGWFIYRNPEKTKYNNYNHFLADLAGQIHLGLLFASRKEAKEWLEEGKKELFHEIRLQILPTGMSYERSTNYNRLVLELILIPLLLLKRNGHEIPQDIWLRLEKMFEFLMYSLKPDGTTPIIGDQDDGRLLPFGVEKNIDYKYLLSIGAILFNRGDFKHYGDGFNVYCALLGGDNSKEKFDTIIEISTSLSSKCFPDAGLYIMRKNDNYLIFNATGKGQYPELPSGTHTHSDLLSFELFINGRTFLVDPGSYVYTADAEQRMLFRSTKMHNTLTIDGESQNLIRKEELWDFARNAIPEILNWESNETLDVVVGKHSGYLRLNEPVTHSRSITFNKQSPSWLITDELEGKGIHFFEWFFHFDFGIDFKIVGNAAFTDCEDENNLMISFTGYKNIKLRKEKSFVSKAYGEKNESFVLVASAKLPCPVLLTMLLSPIRKYETNI